MQTEEKILGKPERLGFGLFEVDFLAGELWKAGHRIRLPAQPFKVLSVLLSKAGDVVTREELQLQVWGSDTNVDFDRALAGAINKVREALGDSADNPRFVETLPKRGYRFIAPVTLLPHPHRAEAESFSDLVVHQPGAGLPGGLKSPDSSPEPKTTETPAVPAVRHGAGYMPTQETSRRSTWSRRELLFAAVTCLLLAAWIAQLWKGLPRPTTSPIRIDQLTHFSPISTGPAGMENLMTLAVSGNRILTSVIIAGKPRLAAISISNGDVQPLALPDELVSSSLTDMSRDGSKLLLKSHLSPESEQPLWVVPSNGGSAQRVGNVLAHDASWMPDGNTVLFASGNDLGVITLDTGVSAPYARLDGRAFWLRWSPDGKLLRFTLMDPLTHTSALWELSGPNTAPHLVHDANFEHTSTCCGSWTADGSAYVFQAGYNLWEVKGSGRSAASVQLTNGPLQFLSPVTGPSSSRIYFLGLETPSGLQVFSNAAQSFQPASSFLADANRVEYSRDGVWVAWTDTDGRLWRAHAKDGSDKLQLTPDYLEAFIAHWAPDGRRLAVMAREKSKVWRIFLVDADGGTPEPLLDETRNTADPGWSADGRSIVFGREPDLMGKENGSHAIEVINLASRKVETLPNSEGLFSPRWSPDGKWIAALSLDQKAVRLYDVAQRRWKELAATSAADPIWSADSKSLYVHAFLADGQPIIKIGVASGSMQTIANLADFHGRKTASYFFGGLTPLNEPMVQPHTGTGNLYTMQLPGR